MQFDGFWQLYVLWNHYPKQHMDISVNPESSPCIFPVSFLPSPLDVLIFITRRFVWWLLNRLTFSQPHVFEIYHVVVHSLIHFLFYCWVVFPWVSYTTISLSTLMDEHLGCFPILANRDIYIYIYIKLPWTSLDKCFWWHVSSSVFTHFIFCIWSF